MTPGGLGVKGLLGKQGIGSMFGAQGAGKFLAGGPRVAGGGGFFSRALTAPTRSDYRYTILYGQKRTGFVDDCQNTGP